MSSLILLSIYLFDFTTKIFGYSIQYGFLHPDAKPIYEVDLSWSSKVYYMEYVDKPPNEVNKCV